MKGKTKDGFTWSTKGKHFGRNILPNAGIILTKDYIYERYLEIK